ncbi:MAG TPA: p-hydroxycinnamoyl CoA hydratase/lyase [Xanthobacteraceae bacterium]|jgi:trans-feruloyl-CoA hydratase/vanillin synthase
MSEENTVTVRIDDAIATVTLNRPAKRNAMSPSLHLEMAEVLERLRYDPASRVLVITGAGASFCAGMDLKQFFVDLKDNPPEFDRIFRIATEWRFRTLRHYPKPTIAMVNGYCFGGAFSIVEGCDLAFAAREATFGLSEINFKHFPGGSVSKSLANLLRPRDALFYAMTGRTFGGDRAAEIGFVNAAYPLADLGREVRALAREIASKDPDALTACKDGYRFSLEMSGEAALNFAAAKSDQLTLRQKDSWRSQGIGDFLQGKYRPGLGGHEKAGG